MGGPSNRRYIEGTQGVMEGQENDGRFEYMLCKEKRVNAPYQAIRITMWLPMDMQDVVHQVGLKIIHEGIDLHLPKPSRKAEGVGDKDYMQGYLPEFYNLTLCRNYSLHYWSRWEKNSSEFSRAECEIKIHHPQLEFEMSFNNDDSSLSLLSFGFSAHLKLLKQCFNVNTCTEGSSKSRFIIGLSTGGGVSVFMFFLCFLLYRRWKKNHPLSSNFKGRQSCIGLSSREDPELGSALNPPIFSYNELYKATDGFNSANEIGDGGFGTVYKGKLKDGRVVAVKRLYKNNYRRLEQFMNEVNILSLLRHQSLVSLYGYTSIQSCELLLVYEYAPNGTVADHLHGSHSSETLLPWQVRMSIAIETADALNYLHSVEPQIIHRDVKTNNILLDKSFHAKIADFGLSRLFPLDATHVSTLPQGTPGYVDPEYHQCFQLTDKSDVYSFGVVLMELISSKPAVDISRDRNEVNLASFAVKKIQKQELHELVDHRLGYHSDCNVNWMINMVAALAFRCLQADRESRPGIKEVLEILRGIEGGVNKNEGCLQKGDAEKDETSLLKSMSPFSPNSVTEAWVSTTSSMSTDLASERGIST
ncbi:hypothetical protein HPP92_027412 [Vanilla planifolia]|uniref:Protein kinase domain-containing protein n=1 Tax=Vanilla planifolia TaxID=51239 RepID=A0A835PBD5_VANPL|nr:hypothetical protein HPP92_027412 [Vanilla planifolia]